MTTVETQVDTSAFKIAESMAAGMFVLDPSNVCIVDENPVSNAFSTNLSSSRSNPSVDPF